MIDVAANAKLAPAAVMPAVTSGGRPVAGTVAKAEVVPKETASSAMGFAILVERKDIG